MYHDAIREHVYPAFRRAMSQPDYICVTLGVCVTGYIVAGGSLTFGLMVGGAWLSLVYYCCHDVYHSYIRHRLSTDLCDIPARFMSQPDSCFWLAEAEVVGGAKVAGMVAVVGMTNGGGGGGDDQRKGGGEIHGKHLWGRDVRGGERSGEIMRLIVAPWCRRSKLGYRLVQNAIDFCQERRFSRVVLETTSTQTAAFALYRKLGFIHTHTHSKTESSRWVTRLSKVTILRMEKEL